ncbi:MAG: ABC transporter substrate-binding protein [Clostridia bacterium]|nr:ABC transporter substrate-binding protein [Clostridia bacterium]
MCLTQKSFYVKNPKLRRSKMKKKFLAKIIVFVLCAVMIFTLAACKTDEIITPDVNLDEVVTKTAPAIVYPSYSGGDTLVVGYSYFSNKFSPFFSKTAYDQDVAAMTQVSLLASDRQGNIIYNGIEGETYNYNGTDYTYNGISDCTVTQNTNGSVYYDFNIRDDLFFSDGVHLTIDDVIFSMYVLSDPSYDGSSTFYALPIKGMTEYRTGVTSDIYTKYADMADDISAAGNENDDFTEFTQAQQDSYWGEALQNAGIKFTQEIIDYVSKNYLSATYAKNMGPYTQQEITGSEALAVAYGMRMWGFGNWTKSYSLDSTGNAGLVGEAYKNLYTPVASEDDALFEDVDSVFYAAATAATSDNDLYYILSSAGGEYTVAKYVGDRYSSAFDGGFKDSDGDTYDFDTTNPTVADYWDCILNAYGYDLSDDGINYESAGSSISDLVKSEFISIEGPNDPLMAGATIDKIDGIKKTGAYSLRIETTKFDATAIYQLGVSVTPLHYYGSRAAYKYTENKFGFTKGDLTTVKAKTTTPMGAGAYKFVSFVQGVVTFQRNGHYYDGCPKISNILFKETTDADKITGVVGTTFDVTDPSFNQPAANAIKAANTNGELTGNTITTSTVDNLGYGYVGISAQNVKVGTAIDSEASKNLRKAFATLIAAYRETAVGSYYGSLATVINYPISNTSWAAPQAADEGYQIAYSVDADGEPIYTADMTAQQKYTAALEAAKGFLEAAGYTWNAGSGTFTAAPAGAKLEYEIIVPGDGIGDHPSFAVCTWVAGQLANIGITLTINDPTDSNILWTALEAGTQELWCAAWGATIDPDMYQVYHSTNAVGQGGTDSNHYGIDDDDLDELIMAARASADTSYRKATYKDCLEIILDWGVEVPIYQRKNAIIFNNSRVQISSVTPDITTFWGWMNDIEALEMK